MGTYQLKHKGEEIDAILEKANAADPLEDLAEIREGASRGMTAVQPIIEDDGEYVGEVIGIIAPNDEHYFLPPYAPADDKVHTFAMKADIDSAIAAAITTTLNEEV